MSLTTARLGADRGEEPTITHDPTSEAAADWVVRLAGDEAGEADWLAFAAWLDAAPPDRPELHRDAFDRAQRIWLQADGLKAQAAVVPAARGRPRAVRPRAAAPTRAARWGLAAAAGVALAVVGLWLAAPPRRSPAPSSRTALYATRRGEHRQVVLPDGSRVELDGATAMAVGAMGHRARSVTLLRGEAAFDIVHDPARPFTVALGGARVRVLGTAFDVFRDPDVMQVSVARGLVAFDTPSRSVRLPAGRGATLTRVALQLRDVAPVEVEGWRQGRRTYWAQPLGVVVADLNRSYDGPPVQIGDTAAQRLRFTGVLAEGTRDETLRRLTALLPLQATTAADGAVVLTSSHR